MRRGWPIVLGATALLGASGGRAPGAAAELHLRRAVLTLGGVGTFEYETNVGADGVATLEVRRADVDDVLKSLTILDATARVAGLRLPGPDGAASAFAALPFGAAALADPLVLLNALRGVPLEVRDAAGQTTLAGRLMAATRQREAVAGTRDGLDRTRVTLLTETGLRQFVLEEAGSVRVADLVLQRNIDAALAAIRGQAANELRTIRLTLAEAAGTVRVAVVTAAPLWKASYRLALPAPGEAAARLQGWAVLENMSPTDWTDVTVALQSGNPVTFRQALYQPLFVERPDVPVAAPTRRLPPVDQAAAPFGAAPMAAAMPPPMPAPMAESRMMKAMAPPAAPAIAIDSVAATLFTLPAPVSLPAGATASVPFLDQSVPAESLDMLDAQAVHPLAAVRLINTTGAGLPAGAVATFEAGDFAGDARLPAVPAGETRLLTFADDAAVTATWQQGDAQAVTGLTVSGGVAHIIRRQRTTITIDLYSAAATSRTLLIAVPRAAEQTVSATGADVAETTAHSWRLRSVLAPGERRSVVAVADQLLGEDIGISDDPEAFLQLRGVFALSPAARTAVDHIAALRQQESARALERDRLQARRQEIVSGEERLRANLAVVPAGDALHVRLLRQLDGSETTLQSLGGEIAQAEAAVQQAHEATAAAIASLSIS